jgi:PhoPQ-activated pathogenicity-related protein
MKISQHTIKIIDGVEHRNIVPKYIILDSVDEFYDLEEQHFGMCTVCGEEHYNCEPDASGYTCDACGSKSVEGISSLLMMGRVI